MSGSREPPESLRQVRAERIATGDEPKPAVAEDVSVVAEIPMTIDVERVETYTILCTPTDRRALVVGFLFSEGVIDTAADIAMVKPCDDDPGTMRVRLVETRPKIDDAGRNLLIVSSCGACGNEKLQERIDARPRVGDTLRMEAGRLRSVQTELRRRQNLFQASGGTHAAAVFSADGSIIAHAEDAARHNALDKAVGKCLLAGEPTAGKGAALTSRLSLEMVSKCARAGVELVAAVSATTSLAVDVARTCNITLCAFVRETRATVFTHPGRITDSPE
jgi:FdhD protein